MSIPSFELTRATSVADACALLADPECATEVIAGGTQLLITLKNGTHAPQRLVDIGAIAGLAEIRSSPEGLSIGAGVTLARLADHPEVARRHKVLAEAAKAVGTLQLRSMGTVAGNLCQDSCCIYVDRTIEQRHSLAPCHKINGDHCHIVPTSGSCWANYAGDLAPALIALDASVSVASVAGTEVRPITSLFSFEGTRPIALGAGELITDIRVPAPNGRAGGMYLKLRQRGSLDYPLLGVAAAVTLEEDGTCRTARVALTGVDRGPVLVPEADRLRGHIIGDELLEEIAHAAYKRARPVKNTFGYGASYRVRMAKPFVIRALRGAAARAEGREVLHG
jgi:4-hydroxybenzoyl-CoA reductase subunit beta